MAVKLRRRTLASGKISLYLDAYNGEERTYEFLRLYLHKRPKDELEKQHNKTVLQTAEHLRAKRELQQSTQRNGLTPVQKTKVNFLAYFQTFIDAYPKKDGRMFKGTLRYLKEFAQTDYLSVQALTESFCYSFKNFLDGHANLTGETPHDYFARFKKVLRQAVRDKLLEASPAIEVTNKRSANSLQKDVLTTEELQLLAQTPCPNPEVKRAFLFACNTGLRLCDVNTLRWTNIQRGMLRLQQQKTRQIVWVNLNATAQKLLGPAGRNEEPVFALPSHTSVLSALRLWRENAGLGKKVTFHVARHSFATNLLIHQTDLKTVSSLLGHTSLTHTQKYVRVVEALKQTAVNRLPELDIAG